MDDGFYPVHKRQIKGARSGEDEVAIIDLGGNLGHDLEELKRKRPGLLGRFVLQDLPRVVAQIENPVPGIEITAHDFFAPQPYFPGARAYYMHSVLHDWSDADCRKILHHVADAMEKGYSKLLINENVVPDRAADRKITSLDWFMMALASSSERTESEWRALLQSVGLKISGIWTADSVVESLIEAVLM
ncbi:hypothetical protein MMC25_004204 [Agyrium rufum]|nr:hypothetical protein [Agyrium rufum]